MDMGQLGLAAPLSGLRCAGSWLCPVRVREGWRHMLGVGTRGQERARRSVSQT